jgi:hypothetical protein
MEDIAMSEAFKLRTEDEVVWQPERPSNEAAQLLFDLMITGQVFFEHEHDHVYIGGCKNMTMRVNCRACSISFDGNERRISREDTDILCREIARQSSLRLAKIKEQQLEEFRKKLSAS